MPCRVNRARARAAFVQPHDDVCRPLRWAFGTLTKRPQTHWQRCRFKYSNLPAYLRIGRMTFGSPNRDRFRNFVAGFRFGLQTFFLTILLTLHRHPTTWLISDTQLSVM